MPKTVKIEDFLLAYKEYETILKEIDPDMTVLKKEEELQGNTLDKLRILRQIRNYIQHHDDGSDFLATTDTMVAFLKNLTNEAKATFELTGDRMYKISPISLEMTLSDALERFAKSRRLWLPVIDENNMYCGVITSILMLQKLAEYKSNTKMKTIFKDQKELANNDIVTVLKNMPIKDIQDTQKIVIINEKGKYLGIIK